MASQLTNHPLFGGAITLPLPTGYIDASDTRQVPDNQEVFLSPDNNASLIVSLLERVDAPDIASALRLHFEDAVLGAENRRGPNADVPHVKSVEQLTSPTRAFHGRANEEAGLLVAAMQTAESERARARARGEDKVVFTGVIMGLIRLKEETTDALIEFHVPHVQGQFDEQGIALEEKKFGPMVDEAGQVMQQIMDGFRVEDWGLFG